MIRFERFLSILGSILVVLLVLGLVAITVIAVSFVSAQAAMRAEFPIPGWADAVVNFTLSALSFDVQTLEGNPETREVVVGILVSASLTALTVWFAMFPIVGYIQHRAAVKRAAVVEVHSVRKEGKSDLKTMHQYYRRGDRITIFCGSFKWILKNKGLRELMIDKGKASKLLLVSSTTPPAIEKAWRLIASECRLTEDQAVEILRDLQPCFRFHEKPFKFSFIDFGQGHTAFLSLVPGGVYGSRRGCNIGVHSVKNHLAHSLLHIVENLCNLEDCKRLPGWDNVGETAQGNPG